MLVFIRECLLINLYIECLINCKFEIFLFNLFICFDNNFCNCLLLYEMYCFILVILKLKDLSIKIFCNFFKFCCL